MSELPVDVIIPVYCESVESLVWFDECIRSAATQGCRVSICDDGSPYVEEVSKIIQKYDNVTAVFLDRNYGVSHARNEAIANAASDYILPLDCDDRLVSNAVRELYDFYRSNNQVPAYPDVSKFGEESVSHYVLLDFSCEHVMKFVGFSSVNVLHSVEQWKSAGKYDESLSFYEDGEYNARLFAKYCGVHYPRPLVEYRIHQNQRTKTYDKKSRQFATTILERIRRLDMPCPGCSKRRTGSNVGQSAISAMATQQSQPAQKVTVNVANAPTHLPIEHEGKILAVYIGGEGKGKHYYQGIFTKQPFKVTHGDYLYADPRDTRTKTDIGSRSMLVRVEKEPEVASPEVVKPVEEKVPDAEPVSVLPTEVAEPEAQPHADDSEVRTPRKAVERTPAKKGKKR